MNLTDMHLAFTGRQDQPINFAGDSDRRSKSGPDLPSAHLINAATGSVTLAQIMASEYNQGIMAPYMGDLLETLEILKYPFDPNRTVIDDYLINLNHV